MAGLAVEGARTPFLERELDAGVALVEVGVRLAGRRARGVEGDDAQLVGREVAVAIDGDLEAVVEIRILGWTATDVGDHDVAHAPTADDAHVLLAEIGRDRGEEVDAQPELVVAHLDVVDAVARRGADEATAFVVATDDRQHAHDGVPPTNVSLRVSPVARIE